MPLMIYIMPLMIYIMPLMIYIMPLMIYLMPHIPCSSLHQYIVWMHLCMDSFYYPN